jgi:topoisomerase-4 subunit A
LLVPRAPAAALDDNELAPAEPVTVVLSEKGWIRAAKGHEIDPNGLSYKGGDRFLGAVRLRSTQPAVFLDSTGRSYSLPANSLPSARGQGEPLTGRLDPPAGAQFIAVLGEEPDRLVLLASDAGYGFLAPLAALYAKPRAGKAVLTLPSGAKVLPPIPIADPTDARLAVATSTGHLLVFPIAELPELPRGKGNKLIAIPAAKAAAREEYIAAMAVLPPDSGLMLHAGKRSFRLRPADLELYLGERGRRGRKLPRGFQRVDQLIAE